MRNGNDIVEPFITTRIQSSLQYSKKAFTFLIERFPNQNIWFSYKVDTLNTLFPLERNFFFTEKRVEVNHKDSAQNVHSECTKKYTKSYLTTQIFMSVKTLFFFLFHFFFCFVSFIWLAVKCKDFLIIQKIFQIFHVFILLYNEKLKVLHKSGICWTWLLCTNMLHFYVALFTGRS